MTSKLIGAEDLRELEAMLAERRALRAGQPHDVSRDDEECVPCL